MANLLRRRESPQRPTFLELFFDLVFVFALTRVVHELVLDYTRGHVADRLTTSLAENGETLLLLLAVWWIWTQTAWMTSRFDPFQPAVQFVVITTMYGSLLLAVAISGALAETGLLFASTYVAIQVGRSLFFVVIVRGHDLRRVNMLALVWFGVSAVPWLAGAFAPELTRNSLWTVALAIDYLGGRLGWPVPGLGRAKMSPWAVAGEHLAERYWQLVIVALGETILTSGSSLLRGPIVAQRTLALTVSFLITVLLWRIYFYRAGQILGEAITASADPGRLGRLAEFSHLLMVVGILASSAGSELVLIDPLGDAKRAWVGAILGGPALFLAGRSVFEYVAFARVSRPRPIGILVLAAMAPIMVGLPPLGVAAAAVVVLLGVAISDTIRAHGRPLEQASPPH
ncbi:low temperature requirement protein A [Micromonospora parathelypteridis]|uniref:Low temperature requirement protein LtrA n=1 Tax=Micromonospora parathelypteridis TaxID=1839617 RepID=A0A840W6N8_9ACTN|nr:low temperature requirement protein A [Micromonospora parathelypteridis]MBB5480728.1 low temperature requirement protein LtrA [Micromonospora parathelypteridis]GGO21948.1 membrane protein [Micromonospora parathelypteridis]